MTIGEKIYLARKEIKITQNELAERIGVSLATILRWEKNRHPVDVYMVHKIAEVTGKPVSFFTEKEPAGHDQFCVREQGPAYNKSPLQLSPEIIDALQDPVAVRALLVAHDVDRLGF
jgi:transcriptional regulator with XRE-family HTH domain